jgi:SAM-dependent methyltransferase
VQNQRLDGTSGIPDYENYDYKAEWRDRSIEDRAEKELIVGMIRRGQNCLELGGGFGRITSTLEPYFLNTVMVDYSLNSLRKAYKRIGSAMLLRSDIRTLPFNDNSFDLVLAIRVLHYIRDLEGLIGDVVRVCRDGATVIFAVPNSRLGILNGVGQNQKVLVGKWNHVAYVRSLEDYSNPELSLMEIRGSGIFDNRIGRRLKRFPRLSKIDVLTSRAWFFKSELFLKYRVDKRKQGREADR